MSNCQVNWQFSWDSWLLLRFAADVRSSQRAVEFSYCKIIVISALFSVYRDNYCVTSSLPLKVYFKPGVWLVYRIEVLNFIWKCLTFRERPVLVVSRLCFLRDYIGISSKTNSKVSTACPLWIDLCHQVINIFFYVSCALYPRKILVYYTAPVINYIVAKDSTIFLLNWPPESLKKSKVTRQTNHYGD